MSKKVLVAVDDTTASEAVADFVNDFFAGFDASVLALNVGNDAVSWGPYAAPPGAIYPWPYAVVPPAMGVAAAPAPAGADDDRRLGDARERGEETIRASGIEARSELVAFGGDVADTVRRVAEERDVDLVVVGSSHKGLLARLIEPSVSADLAKSAPVPVLVVH